MHTKYFGHLKVYTDGSVLVSGDCGCGIYIPSLNFKRSYFMGKHYSIFSAELLAIHLALLYVQELKREIYSVLLCIDSQSVLTSLDSWHTDTRLDLVDEIKHQIHSLLSLGVVIDFVTDQFWPWTYKS